MRSPIYLVPTDFSPVSENALHLGIELADYNHGSVLLLHVVDKWAEKKRAREKFASLSLKLTDHERELIQARVLVGSMYEDIAKAAEIVGASMIVMGTHGSKGLQKVFGSHALKLVSSTSTPFMITQGVKNVEKIENIIMPFYFEKQSLKIASFAGNLAKQFNAKIHLIANYIKSQDYDKTTDTNKFILDRYFSDHMVNHEFINLPRNKAYEKELLDYAVAIDADLLAVAYSNESFIPTMHTFVQELIENDKYIPVMTVNAEELAIASPLSFMTA